MIVNFIMKYKYILIVLISILMIMILFLFIDRVGKHQVAINVIPNDSTVTINNEIYNSRNPFLKPGKYTFKASKKGWGDDIATIDINAENNQVFLLPSPDSDEAIKFLQDNPEIQLKRERIGGSKANQKGENIRKIYPFINYLPYDDLNGPFKIDYGFYDKNNIQIYLIISYSTKNGRREALEWLKSKKVDLSDIKIEYADFENPILNLKGPSS